MKFGPWQWAGLDNYAKLVGDYQFWGALWNTLVIGSISLQCVIALALAFYAYRDPWVQGWRIIFLVPMLFMPSAVAFIYKLAFLDGRVIADLLIRIGLLDGKRCLAVLHLAKPDDPDPRRRMAVDTLPVHHLRRRASKPR